MHHTKFYIRQLLVDASASMVLHQDAMQDLLKEHLDEYRQFVSKHPEAEHFFSLSFFSNDLTPSCVLTSPDAIPDLSGHELLSDGDTALIDAFSRQLDVLETLLREQGINDGLQVEFHLITDGVDTASTAVRFADLRHRIETLQSTGRWTFHFHEADLDTIELNALLGLKRQLAETADPRQLRAALVEFLTPGQHSDKK